MIEISVYVKGARWGGKMSEQVDKGTGNLGQSQHGSDWRNTGQTAAHSGNGGRGSGG